MRHFITLQERYQIQNMYNTIFLPLFAFYISENTKYCSMQRGKVCWSFLLGVLYCVCFKYSSEGAWGSLLIWVPQAKASWGYNLLEGYTEIQKQRVRDRIQSVQGSRHSTIKSYISFSPRGSKESRVYIQQASIFNTWAPWCPEPWWGFKQCSSNMLQRLSLSVISMAGKTSFVCTLLIFSHTKFKRENSFSITSAN